MLGLELTLVLKIYRIVKDRNFFSIIPYKDHLIRFENPIKAKAYYPYYVVDLLTGNKSPYDFNQWILKNNKKIVSDYEKNPRVVHLFYELGFLVEKEISLLADDTLLVIDIKFANYKEIHCKHSPQIKLNRIFFPGKSQYQDAFDKGYAELLKGNCYQFNLTFPFIYSFDQRYTPEDFIFSLWKNHEKRGAFGSATYIPYFNKLFLSNSPECLFQYKEKTLSSMPIKGTVKRRDGEDWKYLWKGLCKDIKSQAELFMISDLVRNDLSRIEFPRAFIVKRKSPKLVPGLLHQYSQIDVELSDDISLWRIIEKVFPGGSVTGAPKLRAIRLIDQLEKRERGFYCGSTLIFYKNMKSASINIRSSVIDFKKQQLLYQAGGAITLMSKVEDEFQEMTYKHDSFICSLTVQNC